MYKNKKILAFTLIVLCIASAYAIFSDIKITGQAYASENSEQTYSSDNNEITGFFTRTRSTNIRSGLINRLMNLIKARKPTPTVAPTDSAPDKLTKAEPSSVITIPGSPPLPPASTPASVEDLAHGGAECSLVCCDKNGDEEIIGTDFHTIAVSSENNVIAGISDEPIFGSCCLGQMCMGRPCPVSCIPCLIADLSGTRTDDSQQSALAGLGNEQTWISCFPPGPNQACAAWFCPISLKCPGIN